MEVKMHKQKIKITLESKSFPDLAAFSYALSKFNTERNEIKKNSDKHVNMTIIRESTTEEEEK